MLQLKVLGSLELVRADGAEVRSVLSQPKRTALLAFVAAARPYGFHRRDTLLALFWPERDEEHARNALNQALYMLRRSLGPNVVETRGRDEVGIAEGVLSCDARDFEAALETSDLERALELYRGELLDGLNLPGTPEFERWLDEERAHLRREAQRAALELAELTDEPAQACRWLERALEIAPTDEVVVRQLMGVLDGAGDRAGALRAYEDFAEGLERNLGIEPSPETLSLADRIRDREEPHPGITTALEGGTGTTPGAEGEGGDGERGGERGAKGPRVTPPGPEAEQRARPAGAPRDRKLGRRVRRVALGAAASLALVAVVALALGVPGSGAPMAGDAAPGSSTMPSVAVLPFDNLSADEEDRYLVDGVTEDIMTALARAGGLHVTSRTSVMKYRDRPADAGAIARDLGVTHLVEGTLRRSGDRIVVSAQLIDARTDRHAWARTYDRAVTDLIAVQREVARAIARELLGRLSPEAAKRVAMLPTADPEAYDFFLRGRDYQTRRSGDPEALNRDAVRMFEAALARDSGFAEAWARLAEAHLNLFQWSAGRASERVDLARRAAERALSADPEGPWGHFALADLRWRGTRDPDRAAEHLRDAEAAGLATSEVLATRAGIVRTRPAGGITGDRERLEESAALYERARALDPLNEGLIFQSWFDYLALRRYEEAEEALERVLELAPDHGSARRYLSRLPLLRDGDAEAVGPPASREWETLWRLGDLKGALAVAPGPPQLPGVEGRARARRGLILADMGDPVAAAAAFDSALVLLEPEVRRDSFPTALRWLGMTLAARGQREEALHVARRAAALHDERFYVALMQILLGDHEAGIATLDEYLANPGARSYRNVATHPLVAPLRDQPRFRALERRYDGE